MLESRQELSARFILARRLDVGGSGEVWLAQDRELDCQVAVKVLSDALMQDVAAVAALEQECRRAGALDHPNILRVHALHRSARHAWIAMEYAAGGNLAQLRGRGWHEVVRATLPIVRALAHAHRAGIVHRDVKATNVLLAADGTPRLGDFGLALAVAAAPAPQAGRGSPYSMSPQQRGGAAACVADDIYGLGAMLYELLSGYPPHYASSNLEHAVLSEPAALPESVPAALVKLVASMIAATPADRPADMDTVERELSRTLNASPTPPAVEASHGPAAVRIEPPSMRAAVPQGEPLRGEWRRDSQVGASDAELRRQGFRRGLGVAAIALGIAGVAVVFFALPKWVGKEPARPAPAAAAVQQPAVAAPVEKKEIDFAQLARLKQQAEEQRAVIDERLQKLVARAAERWGGVEFQRATDELAAGDKDVEAREYATAVEHYAAIEPLLDVLERRAGEVLAAQLKDGAQALQDGRSVDAKTAFELALKIEPGHKVAAAGLKRAGTLDEVLKLVTSAEQLEKQGNLTGAAQQFRQALALDTQAPRAAAAVGRIETRLAGDAFASAMAQGFAALAKADHAGARSAFEAARKIRPNAPEVDQALRQIGEEQRTILIGGKLRRAQESEAAERWAEALTEYRAVLELDSTVAAGQQGVARTMPRAQLNEQLELYLTQPERLFSQPVRAAAHETLAHASAIANPGPLLTRQVATLKEWVTRADAPVAVALESDNLTQVTIYRVGELGSFAQRSLELAPGSYTVVGTRPGYRDVRRQINVMPGAALEPIVIRCEDRI